MKTYMLAVDRLNWKSESMGLLIRFWMVLQGFSPSDTWFDISVRVAREIMKSHIIGSASDKMAVIFYGTVNLFCTPQD